MEVLVEAPPLASPGPSGKNAHATGEGAARRMDRVVLDTNVCLDLFIFRDSRCAHLLDAMRAKQIEAVTRTDCRAEWNIVLRYPNLPIDDTLRREAEREFDALIACIDELSAPDAQPFRLPVCKDKDDQKFLEAAHAAGASALITKDKALLKLARKTARAGMFRILLPQEWRPEAGPAPDAG